MQKIFLFVDKVSTWVGQAFSFCIVVLTLHVAWEVFSRYVLGAPRAWAFDFMIMMYGTLFMMAGAYTLARNGHVRGDVLYGYFTPRTQAALDLTLYIVFFIPGVVALVRAVRNDDSLMTVPNSLSVPPMTAPENGPPDPPRNCAI